MKTDSKPKTSKKKKRKKPKPDLSVIGWMETVGLPDIDLHGIKAKIDTGARTSALHAENIETFDRDGADWVRFDFQLTEDMPPQKVEAPLHDQRHIKNTSGVPEERYTIHTTFSMGQETWPIAVSLADRSSMRFPMIVGRSALKHRNIAVHTHHAYLATTKPRQRKAQQ